MSTTTIAVAFKSKKSGFSKKRNRNFQIVDFITRIPLETEFGATHIDVEWSAFLDEFGTLEDPRQTSKWGVKTPMKLKAAIQEAVNEEYAKIKFDDLPDRPKGKGNTESKTEDELKEGAASAESQALADLA